MARIFKRSLGVIPYSSLAVSRLDLPRNHVFKSLLLRFTGNFTVTGGSAAGTVAPENPQNVLRQIRIVRNGSEVLQSIDGGSAYKIAAFNSDGIPNRTPITDDTAGLNFAFSVDIPIDFAAWRMSSPGITLLRAVGTSSLVLEVVWGTTTDMVVGADGTLAFVNAQVEVFGEELMDLTGDYSDKVLATIQRAITATTTEFAIDLPVGYLYRRLFLKTIARLGGSGTDTLALSDAVVNRVKVISDGYFYHFHQMSWAAIQGINVRHYALTANPTGYAVVDFVEDGNPAGLIDTRGASAFQLVLDVTTGNNTNVIVIPETITPARVAG